MKNKIRREKLIAQGLCTLCGKNIPRKNLLTCISCAEKRKITQKKAHQKRQQDGKCIYCNNEPTTGMKTCELCRVEHKEMDLLIKNKVYAAYGGYKCACCGETEISFLSIDHVNNNGNKERGRLYSDSGGSFYRYLKRNNYPIGYQVLCMNCQWGKRMNNGICPHKLIDNAVQKSSDNCESTQ